MNFESDINIFSFFFSFSAYLPFPKGYVDYWRDYHEEKKTEPSNLNVAVSLILAIFSRCTCPAECASGHHWDPKLPVHQSKVPRPWIRVLSNLA
jgi:hypothetical protein